MNTKFTIKNFRVFDENGATIDIKPITILTGANSSGKSTVVKAVFLLQSFLAQIKTDLDNNKSIEFEKYKIDFTTYPNNLLGRFDKVIHEGTTTDRITIEYTVHSSLISKDVTVQLVFASDVNDELNNAFLECISFSTDKGIFYSAEKRFGSFCNLNIIKNDCIEYMTIEDLLYEFSICKSEEDMYYRHDNTKTDVFISRANDIKNALSEHEASRVEDAMKAISGDKNPKLINKLKNEFLRESVKNDTFFVIPLLDTLSSIKKPDFESFIRSIILDKEDNALAKGSTEVINDFLTSKYDSFIDYFKAIEINYLNHLECNINKFSDSRMCLPYSGRIMLSQEYLISKCSDNKKDPDCASFQEINKKWSSNASLKFDIVYEVVMQWNKLLFPEENNLYEYGNSLLEHPFISCYHYAYWYLVNFIEALSKETICPDWCSSMSYISSARADVKRLYTLDNNDDFTKTLQNYFEAKRSYQNICDNQLKYVYSSDNRDYTINHFLNKWIRKFEIGEAISLNLDPEGIGVQIRLHHSQDDEGRLLADEGFGITQLISILIQIETAILSAKGTGEHSLWGFDELGKNQPSVFTYETNTIAIEEPEIHLHPKYQSLLCDMFLDAYKNYNIHFIIETHSEYLIRKSQVFVSKAKYRSKAQLRKNCPFSVYYMPSDGNKPYQMEYRTDGKFSNEFKTGFFDEAINLVFEIL